MKRPRYWGSGVGDPEGASAAQAGLGGAGGIVAGPDLLYANLTCIASGLNTTGQSLGPPVNFVESRGINFVDVASDYMLSIIRWTSTGLQLPLFIPTIDTAPGVDANTTTYQIGMTVYTPADTATLGTGGSGGSNACPLILDNTSAPGTITMWMPTWPSYITAGDSIWLSGVPDAWTTSGLSTAVTVTGFAAGGDEGSTGVGERELTVVSYTPASGTAATVVQAKTADGTAWPDDFCNAFHNQPGDVNIPSPGNGNTVANLTNANGGTQPVQLDARFSILVWCPTQQYMLTIAEGYVTTSSGGGTWATPAAFAADLQTAINTALANQNTVGQGTEFGNKLLATSGATVTASGTLTTTSAPSYTITLPFLKQPNVATPLNSTFYGLGTDGRNYYGATYSSWDYPTAGVGYMATLSGGDVAHGNAQMNGPALITGLNNLAISPNINFALPTSAGPLTINGGITGTIDSNHVITLSGTGLPIFSTTVAPAYNSRATLSGATGNTQVNATWQVKSSTSTQLQLQASIISTAAFSGVLLVVQALDSPLFGMSCSVWPRNPLDPNTRPGTNNNQPYSVYLGWNTSRASPTDLYSQASGKYLWNTGSFSAGGLTWGGDTTSFGPLGVPAVDVLQFTPGMLTSQAYTSTVSLTLSTQNGQCSGVPYTQIPQTMTGWLPKFLVPNVTAVNSTNITVSGQLANFYLSNSTNYAVGQIVLVSGILPGTSNAAKTLNGYGVITSIHAGPVYVSVLYFGVTPDLTGYVSGGTLTPMTPMTVSGGQGSYSPYVFVRTLQWTPQYPADPAPLPPALNDGNMDVRQGSRYYWATDPQHVLNMVNSGLDDIWRSVRGNTAAYGNFPGFGLTYGVFGGGSLASTAGPAFQYSNGQVVLNLPLADYTFQLWQGGQNTETNGYAQPMYRIAMNPALYSLFQGFPSAYRSVPPTSKSTALDSAPYPTSAWGLTDNETSGSQGVYELVPPSLSEIQRQAAPYVYVNSSNVPVTPFVSPYAVLQVPQQAACTDNWAAVSALSFHTSLPIVPEDESAPAQASVSFAPSTTRDIVTSMTDIQLDLAGGVTDWIGKISYEPTSQYRWSLMQGGPIQSMSFSVYWKHRATGRRYLTTLMPGGSVEVKLLMQKR